MILFTVFLLIIPSTALFIAIFWLTANKKPSKLVLPGDRGLPFIGETLSFLKPHPADSLGDYMEDHFTRFGRKFSSRLLGREAIISADIGLNRFVLKNDVEKFTTTKLQSILDIFGKALPFADGETRKKLRPAITDFYMNPKRLQNVFLREADFFASAIVSSWKDGSVISAYEESSKFSMKLMAKITLNTTPDDRKMELLARDFSHFLPALLSIPIKFPGIKYWKAIKARENVVNMIKNIMDERVKLMSKVCEESKEKDENFNKVEEQEEDYDLLDFLKRTHKLSDEAIVDTISMALFSGYSTTSKSIAFMLYLLTESPTVVKMLQEEHLQIIKSKPNLEQKLSWDDYKNMIFTDCVINEALRLCNVVPYIAKTATKDVNYEDIVIPKDCVLLINVRAVHLDPSIYDNPTQFNPWRWLDPTIIKNRTAYMPFSCGARMCKGANLAKLQMAIFLHHIIVNYKLEKAQPDHPMAAPFTEFSKGLPIRVHAAHIFK